MYLITEKEDYENQAPLVIVDTIDQARMKILEFNVSRSQMIDEFNIYDMNRELAEHVIPTLTYNKSDGIFYEHS